MKAVGSNPLARHVGQEPRAWPPTHERVHRRQVHQLAGEPREPITHYDNEKPSR